MLAHSEAVIQAVKAASAVEFMMERMVLRSLPLITTMTSLVVLRDPGIFECGIWLYAVLSCQNEGKGGVQTVRHPNAWCYLGLAGTTMHFYQIPSLWYWSWHAISSHWKYSFCVRFPYHSYHPAIALIWIFNIIRIVDVSNYFVLMAMLIFSVFKFEGILTRGAGPAGCGNVDFDPYRWLSFVLVHCCWS